MDEWHNLPLLSQTLEDILKQPTQPGHFILISSQHISTPILKASYNTTLYVLPLSTKQISILSNTPIASHYEAMFHGSFPELHLHLTPQSRSQWYSQYVATLTDLATKTLNPPFRGNDEMQMFQMFLRCCAGFSAELLNCESLANNSNISIQTAKTWLDFLEHQFIIFRLPYLPDVPYMRTEKQPKLHFYDTGLLCWLLGLQTSEELYTFYMRDEIFESWVVSEIVTQRAQMGIFGNIWFYKDKTGRHIPLVLRSKNQDSESIYWLIDTQLNMTFFNRFFEKMEKHQKPFQRAKLQSSIIVIYAGSDSMTPNGHTLVPWQDVASIEWLPQDTTSLKTSLEKQSIHRPVAQATQGIHSNFCQIFRAKLRIKSHPTKEQAKALDLLSNISELSKKRHSIADYSV